MVEVPGDTHTITCTRLTLLDGSHLFLRTKWFTASFSVTALDFPRSWSCNVSKQEVERRANMWGVSGEEFLSQSRSYLGDGVSESEYSFQKMNQPSGLIMRLSWTNMRFNQEPISLFLQKGNNTMELVPEFLNALMDTTLVLKDLLARRKIKKYKKVRQLAIRFSAPEKVRKRSLSQRAPEREAIRGGLDGLVVKSEFPGRLVTEQEALPLYGHQTPFCFDRPHALGSYVGESHGQLKSIPSEYRAISESRREQAQARNGAVQVPMTDDRDSFLDRVGSSHLKLPVKVDIYDGIDIGPPSKHPQEFTATLFEHGLSSWSQPSRPSTFHDVAVHQSLHRSPACDNGVLSYESRKLDMESLDGSGWINPRKSSIGVENSTFGIASQGREDIIMLSDSDEETYHDDEIDAGIMDGDDEDNLVASKRYWMTKDIGWQSRSRKRKEMDDAHEVRIDPRNRNGQHTQVCASAATTGCIKVESKKHASTFKYGSRTQCKPVYHTADNRSQKFLSTFNHESRAQWNTWISEAKSEVPSWEARIQNKGFTTGASCHLVDHPSENVVNTSSPTDLQDLHNPPSLKKLDKTLDVVDFANSDSEHLQSPTENQNVNIPPSEGNSVRERQEDVTRNLAEQPERSYTREMGKSKNKVASDDPQPENVKVESGNNMVENDRESDSVPEHVYKGGDYNDDDRMTGIGESAAKKMQNKRMNSASTAPLEKGSEGRKLPGRRGRPPGTKSQLHPKPTKSMSQGVTICNNGRVQSDIDLRNTSSQHFLRAARPVGRPKHGNSYGHAPAADYVVKNNLVDVDQDLQKAVPDSDYYFFDGDRGREKIKPNQVWALYDDIDTMPRTLIRVKEVSSMNGPFWVKAIWLQPHNWAKKSEREKKTGFPISCGDFEEPKESTVIRALNCFSHKMDFTPKTNTIIQVYPRKGEIWALHHNDKTGEIVKQARSEKDKKGKGNDNEKYQFRLVVIVSNCGEDRENEILVLRKRTGYRTLWEPGYKKGSLPVEYMQRFSHRVPAYKLTEKDYPDLNNLDIWDIDAAAVPACQSKVT